MYHILTGQMICLCNLCFSSLTSVKCSAFGKQLWTSGSVNCTVYATASEKRIICCVYDCLHICCCGKIRIRKSLFMVNIISLVFMELQKQILSKNERNGLLMKKFSLITSLFLLIMILLNGKPIDYIFRITSGKCELSKS